MKPEKTYTPDQLAFAARALAYLASLPEDRRSWAVMAANAFISGMEAQARLTAQGQAAQRPAARTG